MTVRPLPPKGYRFEVRFFYIQVFFNFQRAQHKSEFLIHLQKCILDKIASLYNYAINQNINQNDLNKKDYNNRLEKLIWI